MQALKAGSSCVDLNDNLLGHLDDLGRCPDTGSRNDATILRDGGGFDDCYILWLSDADVCTSRSLALRLTSLLFGLSLV